MEQNPKPFTELVEDLVLQISHKDKPDNTQKNAIQHKYKKFGIDDKPYFMNFGIDDQEAQQIYASSDWTYDYYKPFGDQLSQQLICFTLNKYKQHCDLNPELMIDIGCGNGGPTTMAVDMVNPKKAIGLDLVREQTWRAKTFYNKQLQLSFIQADAEHIPLPSSSVDLVTNFESSHLYPNLSLFFDEVSRVLKPHGYFVYADVITSHQSYDIITNQLAKNHGTFECVYYEDITAKVCEAVYKRIVTNERSFLQSVHRTLKGDLTAMMEFAAPLSILYGALLLTSEQINELSPKFRNSLTRIAEKFQQCVDMNYKSYVFYLLKRVGNN